ncbi:MAG: DsbA family protein [Rhodospirillaceae bacterium]|nr:DsbA family protein [Rhodospirillaceae bacterium]
MADPITLYFDLPSAHTYLGVAELQKVAARHGRDIDWVPISLMTVWKIHDYMPIGNPIAKGRYIKKDFTRTAGLLGLPLNIPKSFPRGDLSHARHLIWRVRAQDPAKANALAAALMLGYWADGQDLVERDVLAAVAAKAGVAAPDVDAAADDAVAAEACAAASREAAEAGIFGTPHMVADGEPFWGHDRIRYLDMWLEAKA